MKILVTGGAGFIGSHVVEELLRRGHVVRVIDDLSAGSRVNLPDDVDLVVADIRGVDIYSSIMEFRPAAVIHLAAQIDLRKSIAEPVFDADVNVLGSLRVLQAAHEAGCRQAVFASSSAVYGLEPTTPTDENHPTAPVTPYGVAKLAVEHYLNVYRAMHGWRAAALRFANVYGPRQGLRGEGGVISIFASRLIGGTDCNIFGDGSATRDYVFVEDVARAVAMAVENKYDGVINVSTGVETSVRDLYTRIRDIIGVVGEPKCIAPANRETPRSALVPTKATREIDFTASVDLTAGLRRTVDWFRTRV